jgi:hypothetical protein
MMENLLATQISLPMSHMVFALGTISVALIFGYIKLSLLIGYGCILYWSQIWNLSLFSEASAWKLSSPGFLLTGLTIIIVLISMISLIFHKE